MKYTIEGFSQEYALSLRKEVTINGSTVVKKIDCIDLVILRWLIDFYPRMDAMIVDGERYVFVSFNRLQKDMPLLDISKRALSERMQKLVEFGILKYKLKKEGGTFALFAIGENYENLVQTKNVEGVQSNAQGVTQSTTQGVCVQTHNKNSSIINSSIKENKSSPLYSSPQRVENENPLSGVPQDRIKIYGISEFLNDNPHIMIDENYCGGTIDEIPFAEINRCIKESHYLQGIENFSFFTRHYKAVIAGKYKDSPNKPTKKKQQQEQEENPYLFTDYKCTRV